MYKCAIIVLIIRKLWIHCKLLTVRIAVEDQMFLGQDFDFAQIIPFAQFRLNFAQSLP